MSNLHGLQQQSHIRSVLASLRNIQYFDSIRINSEDKSEHVIEHILQMSNNE